MVPTPMASIQEIMAQALVKIAELSVEEIEIFIRLWTHELVHLNYLRDPATTHIAQLSMQIDFALPGYFRDQFTALLQQTYPEFFSNAPHVMSPQFQHELDTPGMIIITTIVIISASIILCLLKC